MPAKRRSKYTTRGRRSPKNKVMEAAILEHINAPLRVGKVTLTPPKFGQVLVRVLVSGICGAQLQEIAGNKNNAKYMPHLLGHEGAGIVEATGIGVTKVKQGDKVVMHWRPGVGIDADFPTYLYKGIPMRSGKVTTLSQYALVSENRVTPVPHHTPNELCALLGCSLSTALGTINLEAEVKFGESVLVVGAGGLGVNLITAARLAGAYPIIAIDIHDHKEEGCMKLGAHLYVNVAQKNLSEELERAFGIRNIDVIIETSGNKHAFENTLPLLSGTGRYILVGQPKPGESIEIKNAHHLFEGVGKTIKATQGGRFSPSSEIPRYVKFHEAGVLSIDHIITHRFKLRDINQAIDLVREGQAGRVIIDMSL